LADFLLAMPHLRRIGKIRDVHTFMYAPYVVGTDETKARASMALEAQQPWVSTIPCAVELKTDFYDRERISSLYDPGQSPYALLNACTSEPDASSLYDRCNIREPVARTSLWRLLLASPPSIVSPWVPRLHQPALALEHLHVDINGPCFSHLHDLSKACVTCMPRLKTLRLDFYGCTMSCVDICAGLWWFVKPPLTVAGTLRLEHLLIVFGAESSQHMSQDTPPNCSAAFDYEYLEEMLNHYLPAAPPGTARRRVHVCSDPEGNREKLLQHDLLLTGCDLRQLATEPATEYPSAFTSW
jgi:hypothetical protein